MRFFKKCEAQDLQRFKVILIFFTVCCISPLVFKLYSNGPKFGARTDCGELEQIRVREASGLAASRKNAGILWTHNDSDSRARIFALDSTGKHVAEFVLPGVRCRDWEDIAVAPGPVAGESYLYIGDIGDNLGRYDVKYIYRIPEPVLGAASGPISGNLEGVETIAFRFPDGKRDAETLMVDPLTRDIYVVSKRESRVRVYRAAFPQQTEGITILEHVGEVGLTNVVAGDISGSGLEILLKTYDHVYYWRRSAEMSLPQALASQPVALPYILEPQGEAICWDIGGAGYYTTSEEPGGIPAHLYYYPRLSSGQKP